MVTQLFIKGHKSWVRVTILYYRTLHIAQIAVYKQQRTSITTVHQNYSSLTGLSIDRLTITVTITITGVVSSSCLLSTVYSLVSRVQSLPNRDSSNKLFPVSFSTSTFSTTLSMDNTEGERKKGMRRRRRKGRS